MRCPPRTSWRSFTFPPWPASRRARLLARPREPSRHGPAARGPAGAARLERTARRGPLRRPSCSMRSSARAWRWTRSTSLVDDRRATASKCANRSSAREPRRAAPRRVSLGADSDDAAKILDIKQLLGAAFAQQPRPARQVARDRAAAADAAAGNDRERRVDAGDVRGRGTRIRARARRRAGNSAGARRRRGRAARRGARPRGDVVARPPAAAAVVARAARLSAGADRRMDARKSSS